MIKIPAEYFYLVKGQYELARKIENVREKIRKVAPKKVLIEIFGNYIDVENDARIPAAAEKLGMSVPCLIWRLADLMDTGK